VGRGDELVGLVRGFIAAGAAAVVPSLWTLSDLSAHRIMARTYARWKNEGGRATLAGALRSAMIETMQEQPNPVFWAGFVLVGGSET